MAEAGEGIDHTPLTPELTPAPRASHYPWQGDRPAARPSLRRELEGPRTPRQTRAYGAHGMPPVSPVCRVPPHFQTPGSVNTGHIDDMLPY